MSFSYVPPRERHFDGKKNKKKKTVSMILPEEMYKFFKSLADARGMTFTDVVTDILDQVAEQLDKESSIANRGKK